MAILDLRFEQLSETKELCEKHGVIVKAYDCDVTDMARVRAVLKEVERDLGPIE